MCVFSGTFGQSVRASWGKTYNLFWAAYKAETLLCFTPKSMGNCEFKQGESTSLKSWTPSSSTGMAYRLNLANNWLPIFDQSWLSITHILSEFYRYWLLTCAVCTSNRDSDIEAVNVGRYPGKRIITKPICPDPMIGPSELIRPLP